jgi:cysteine desulfurase family protein (TIGR01976 family)
MFDLTPSELAALFDRFSQLRRFFPGLNRCREGVLPIFLDGPGGTQVHQAVIDRMVWYLTTCNANHGGAFATSRESDEALHQAHLAIADLLHANSPDEIVFGANMTTLTLHLSRAIGRTLRPGDEVMVTRMDHDANVTPWILAARDAGARVRYVDIHPEDCTLDLDNLRRQLTDRTRLVAVTCASNAVGTINDVRSICRWAHEAGARVFLDAVHYAPHGPIDVQEWGCDFLVCSAYKFFGPHLGVLWGKREHLEELPAYKLRPVPESLPDRWMTGTQNHEGIVALLPAVVYLAGLPKPPKWKAGLEVSRGVGQSTPFEDSGRATQAGRHWEIQSGLACLQAYEAHLAGLLLDALAERPSFKIWGIRDRSRLHERAPTIAITMQDRSPEEMARFLAERQIYAWHGNMYAIGLTERLGLEDRGGLLRLGIIHYNAPAEIARLVQVLDEL